MHEAYKKITNIEPIKKKLKPDDVTSEVDEQPSVK